LYLFSNLYMAKYIALFGFVLLLWGCRGQRPDDVAPAAPPVAVGTVPPADSVLPPRVTLLDTCPAPVTFTVANNQAPARMSPAVFSVNMITYAAEQGLYSLVYVIKPDRQGNFWFCTGGGGVIRYDGKTATSFTTAQGLASNNVRSMAEDKNGNLWFGSVGGGATVYDGRTFTTINKSNGLNSNNIRGITADEHGLIWMATAGGGINIYDGKSFSLVTSRDGLVSDIANCMIRARDGSIWYGTDSGVSRISGWEPLKRQGRIVSLVAGSRQSLQRVANMAEDRDGNIWLGTDGGGVSCVEVSGDSLRIIRTFTTANGLPNNVVHGVYADSRGKIWFGMIGSGVSCYDPALLPVRSGNSDLNSVAGALTTYTTEHGLCSDKVECAAEDESGNLWFGTDGGGVSRFDGAYFKIRIEPVGALKTSITCIKADKKGNIWLSSNATGVLCYDGRYFRSYDASNMLGDGKNSCLCMLEDSKGHFWMGTSGKGLYCTGEKPASGRPAKFTVYSMAQGLPSDRVYCVTEDRRGRIWIGTSAGVACMEGNRITSYGIKNGLKSASIWCSLLDDNGDIWFGTFGGGISKFVEHPADGGAPRFMSYTTTDGLASNSIKYMIRDRGGSMWLATGGGGISRFDGTSFINYTTVDGLSNNIAITAGEDKYGNLWFGTNEGLSVIKGFAPVNDTIAGDRVARLITPGTPMRNKELAGKYKPVFDQYKFKNGFPIKDVNTNSMYIDSAGVIWAGTADKLISFDRAKLDKNVETPRVFLNAIRVNGERISWNTLRNERLDNHAGKRSGTDSANHLKDSLAMVNEEMAVFGAPATNTARNDMYKRFMGIHFDSITPFNFLPVNLELPYRNNNITFDFTAIEPARPYLVRYKYKLDGYDKDWSPVTERSNASFGNISEGTYTFQLCAQSPDGVWSAPVLYTFKVLPPLYRTWWAYVLYCLAIGYFIYLVVYVRTGMLKKENLRLEQIVHDRTAQIELEKAAVVAQAEEMRKLNLFKDKTFSVLSHDLRGPINTSATVLSMLDDSDLSLDEFKDMKDSIVKQLTATSVLLDNLLKWAKGSMEGSIEAHKTNVRLADIVQRHATLFQENLKAKNIHLVIDVPEQLIVWCDAEQLEIVTRNLLANAIKFTPKEGTITVSAFADNDEVHIRVADTGVGMSTEQLDKLFKPATDNSTYGTAGERGTGLGLLLSHEFVKANNGRIDVVSEVGKGSAFTVVLPAPKA
jgi:signal transduction histidine kinase/ligand-binding sensor domain-containing protein